MVAFTKKVHFTVYGTHMDWTQTGGKASFVRKGILKWRTTRGWQYKLNPLYRAVRVWQNSYPARTRRVQRNSYPARTRRVRVRVRVLVPVPVPVYPYPFSHLTESTSLVFQVPVIGLIEQIVSLETA